MHALTALPLMSMLLLAACGGVADDAGTPQAAATTVTAPLLDDDGLPAAGDPRAKPADATTHTRAARYAMPSQADALERALGTAAIAVAVGCCDDVVVEHAVAAAHAVRAQRGLGADAPVLVRGSEPRFAADVAERLTTDGFGRVWLVTP